MNAFSIQETHGILLRPESEVRATSHNLGWIDIFASVQCEQPYKASYHGVPDDLIIMHLDGPVGVGSTVGGTQLRRIVPPRGLVMMPGTMDFGIELDRQLESLHLYLRHKIITEVASELLKRDVERIEILPKVGEEDPLIEQLMLEIRNMIENKERSDEVYVEYVSLALAARLVRRHSTLSQSAALESDVSGGLTRQQITRVMEFMDSHLDQGIGLKKIAKAVDLSVTHFARLFKVSTGMPPHQYLIRRRFERAKWLLSQTEYCIAEIAFSVGFSHQEHMTRVFRRLGDTTPAKYRRSQRPRTSVYCGNGA